jgi:hypothetical protein
MPLATEPHFADLALGRERGELFHQQTRSNRNESSLAC